MRMYFNQGALLQIYRNKATTTLRAANKENQKWYICFNASKEKKHE